MFSVHHDFQKVPPIPEAQEFEKGSVAKGEGAVDRRQAVDEGKDAEKQVDVAYERVRDTFSKAA